MTDTVDGRQIAIIDLDNGLSTAVLVKPVADELFVVSAIPLEAYGISYLDVISARREESGRLRSSGIVRKSGHRTLRLALAEQGRDADLRVQILDRLGALGCGAEYDPASGQMLVDVPEAVAVGPVVTYVATAGFPWEVADPPEGFELPAGTVG